MKNKVLEKASDMFLNYGFKSVTMDDIAKELAISKKTIYAHYNTKRKLVEDVALYILQELNHGFNCICTKEIDPIEELFEMKSLVLQMLTKQKISPRYQLEKYYPKIYGSLKQRQFESVSTCITNNIEKGIELGFYRENLAIDFITRLYFSCSTSLYDDELFPHSSFNIANLIDQHLEYHVRAIATEKGLNSLNKILNK